MKQSLWIDTDSLLPLRWEVALPRLPAPYGMMFTYEAIDLAPPTGVSPPDVR